MRRFSSFLLLTAAGLLAPCGIFAKSSAEQSSEYGQMYVGQKDYDQAVYWFKLATEQEPKEGWYWLYLGNAYYQKNDCENAVPALTQAYITGPKRKIGEKLLGLGKGKRRQQETKIDAEALKRRGHCHSIKGDDKAAISDLETAAWKDYSDPWPYNRLSDIAFRQKDYAKSKQYLESALGRDQDQVEARAELGRARVIVDGDIDAGLADFAKAMAAGPEPIHVTRPIWDAYLFVNEKGRWADCVRLMDWSLAQFASEARFWAARGTCRRNSGAVEGAVSDFEEALRLDAGNSEAAVGLAALRSQQAASSAPDPPSEAPAPPNEVEPANEQPTENQDTETVEAPVETETLPDTQTPPEPESLPSPAGVPESAPTEPAASTQAPAEFPVDSRVVSVGIILAFALGGFFARRRFSSGTASVSGQTASAGPPPPSTRSFEIMNPGMSRLDLEISSSAPWLEVSPGRIILDPKARLKVQVALFGSLADRGRSAPVISVRSAGGSLLAEISVLLDSRP